MKETIISQIEAAIKGNNNQEITGRILQGILKVIVEGTFDSIPEVTQQTGNSQEMAMSQKAVTDLYNQGYRYIGTATPSTAPIDITEDNKLFYIAASEGNYTNFGLPEISESTIIKSDNGSWVSENLGLSIVFSELIYDRTLYNLGMGAGSQKWTSYSNQKHVYLELDKTRYSKIRISPKTGTVCSYAFTKTYTTPTEGTSPDFATGASVLVADTDITVDIPSDANYLIMGVYSEPAAGDPYIMGYPYLSYSKFEGYTYLGTATPSTAPIETTTEDKVFYIAVEEGDYTNFGLSEINELTIIKSKEGGWTTESLCIPFKTFSELDYDKTLYNLGLGGGSQKWTSFSNQKHVYLELDKTKYSKIKISPKTGTTIGYAFLKTYNPVDGGTPDFATGSSIVALSTEVVLNIPSDANYLVMGVYSENVPGDPYIMDYPYLYTNQNTDYDGLKSTINSSALYFAKDKEIIEEIKNLEWEKLGIGSTSNNWTDYGNKRHVVYPVSGISEITITPATASTITVISFLQSYTAPTSGITPDYVDGTLCAAFTSTTTFIVPKGAKFLTINVYDTGVTPNNCIPSSVKVTGFINQMYENKMSRPAEPNKLHYNTVSINPDNIGDGNNSSNINSGFGYKLPSSYSQFGKPSKVCFFLHGYSGYVTESILGYNWAEWTAFQNKLLDAGFIVLDINGYGEYSASTPNNDHWGCQQALFTLKKAFKFLKENYNVQPKANIYGYSMGGALAYSYTMNFPEDIDLVALHAPSSATNYVFAVAEAYASIANRYGYDTYKDAEDDGFKNFIGYALPLTFIRLSSSGAIIPNGMAGYNLDSAITDTIIGKFPKPLRIWQGDNDANVPYMLNQNIVDALRNGGSNATLSILEGVSHADVVNSVSVQNETVSFLKRVL